MDVVIRKCCLKCCGMIGIVIGFLCLIIEKTKISKLIILFFQIIFVVDFEINRLASIILVLFTFYCYLQC